MAILKLPPRPPKNETLQIRVEEQIKTKLHKYAEFINSSESYVVNEALKLLFKKDREFTTWLEELSRNGDQPQNLGGPLRDSQRDMKSSDTQFDYSTTNPGHP